MTEVARPLPIDALRAALSDSGVDLPEALLQRVLTHEEHADPDVPAEMRVAGLRRLIEETARQGGGG